MNLQIAIIHMDMVVKTLDLEPGEYSLGRSSDNNIVVQHFSLEPQHGKIFFEQERWFYQDASGLGRKAIGDGGPLVITEQISLATQKYVESGNSQIHHFSVLRGQHKEMLNKRILIASGMVILLMLASFGGYQLFRQVPETVQQSKLISRVRSKIVEFESVRDDQSIADIKKYGGLQDSDFKDSSGFCTGFLVGPNIVLTAAHCLFGRFVIDMNNDFYLKTSDGKSHQIKEVLGFDLKRDYLYLRAEGMEEYGHLEFAPGYDIEQKVYTVGNVHGEGIAIRDGIISSETADQDEPDVKFLRYSAGTSPGNSGGPLLNENGDVVALVFAATYSENFNLGTPAKDLIAAYERFVGENTGDDTVNLALKRLLNFKPAVILQSLALPYLPQFDEYPEVSKAFNDIAVDIKVPIPFETVDEEILEPLNQKVVKTFEEVQAILREKEEIVLDWHSFVTDETPAILPSQFDISQSVFTKVSGRYYPYLSGFIDSPSKADFSKYKEQLRKEKKFDFQAYGYNVEIAQEKFDLLKTDVFYKPKDNSGNKQRIQNLSYGAPYSQLVVYGDGDLRRQGFFGLKLFMKNFVGKEGVLASSASRFVRPLAMRDFTIADFDFDNEQIVTTDVKDRFGRVWKRDHIKILEGMNILTYCKELPEATHCVGRVLNVANDYLYQLIESNFRKFILSHLLINPYFWSPDSLIEFTKSEAVKGMRLMEGVSLKETAGKLSAKLKGFPVTMSLPKKDKIQSMRLQTGMVGDSKQSEWAGYGVEWVQKEKDKDLVCGAGVELFNSQSSFMLNFLRDRRKQEKLRKIKGEDAKPLPGVWYKPFRGMKRPFQIYGYCAPLQEDPRVSGQYFVDFKNAKPYKVPYKIN